MELQRVIRNIVGILFLTNNLGNVKRNLKNWKAKANQREHDRTTTQFVRRLHEALQLEVHGRTC